MHDRRNFLAAADSAMRRPAPRSTVCEHSTGSTHTWSHVLSEGTKSPTIAFSPSAVAFAFQGAQFRQPVPTERPIRGAGCICAATFALGFGMTGTLLQPNAGRF